MPNHNESNIVKNLSENPGKRIQNKEVDPRIIIEKTKNTLMTELDYTLELFIVLKKVTHKIQCFL